MDFSTLRQCTTLWFYTTYCPLTVAVLFLCNWRISLIKTNLFQNNSCSKQLLTNLEDEIFLKGGSVVTPQNFGLVLSIKMLPRNKTFPFLSSFTFCDFWIFASSGENLQRYCWACLISKIKQLFISGSKCCKIYFPQSFIPLKWFLLHLEPVLHYNLFTNAFKNSTKIWGCHVMVPHHFYAKIPAGYWKFWALYQFFQSAPVGPFTQQLF